MSINRRLVTLVLCSVLVFAALVGYFVPTADALPQNEVWRKYFSDASYTNLVGERWLMCDGSRSSWGVLTSYVLLYSYPCSW